MYIPQRYYMWVLIGTSMKFHEGDFDGESLRREEP